MFTVQKKFRVLCFCKSRM